MRLYYHEVDANRKLEQPGCISAIIYSNKGPYTSVINGRYVTADGLPIWPSVTTSWDEASENTIKIFTITPNDIFNYCAQGVSDGSD